MSNYRCFRHVDFQPTDLNVVFGPNGAGKSTVLDALWFVRDCAIRGTEEAASNRHHGIGVLADNAPDDDQNIRIGIETSRATYDITFGYAAGRIEPFVGERLYSKSRGIDLIRRAAGSSQALLHHTAMGQTPLTKLIDPEKLALSNYLLFTDVRDEAEEIDTLLKSLHFYGSRSIPLFQLRKYGAESSVHTYLWDRWQNLWSALRNLRDRPSYDRRYATIMTYMKRAFPGSFLELTFEPLGADRVGCSFVERGRRLPVQASGVSDGHLQMLGLLTCLFGDPPDRSNLILFDEPETSLHPHAITVFGAAAIHATTSFRRQIVIATHSPVLISQFDPGDIVVAERGADQFSTLRRVSEIADLKDLLDHYTLGSLYMTENVGMQSREPALVAGGGEA